MSISEVYKAWATLLALSFATVALTLVSGASATVVGGVLLTLSGLKARTILSRYLELRHSAFWMRLFDTIVGVFLLIAFILYAAPWRA